MRSRRRTRLLGLALVLLLALGVGVSLLWPMPCEAEQTAALLHIGMLERDACQLIDSDTARIRLPNSYSGLAPWPPDYQTHSVFFADGSRAAVDFQKNSSGEWRLSSVKVEPPDPPLVTNPLTRLRRTLARILPFLVE